MDDISPKRSLREILPKSTAAASASSSSLDEKKVIYWEPEKRANPLTKILVWLFVVVLAGVVVYALSSYVAWAVVKVTPRQDKIALDGVYQTAAEAGDGILAYQTISGIEETASKEVPATGWQQVSKKAVGTVTISNNFSTAPQTLVASTRLEALDGKIYRLNKGVTVPGQKVEGGKTVSGTVTAEATADGLGQSYNSGPMELKIVGFKGTPRFDAFSVKTAGFQGGLVGQVQTMSPKDKAQAITELEASLKQKVLTRARTQLPLNFVLYDNAAFINYAEVNMPVASSTSADSKIAAVTLRATLKGIIFNVDNLSNYLTRGRLPVSSSEAKAKLINADKLVFDLLNREKVSIDDNKTISFSLKGEGHFIWQVDEEALRTRLTGATKASYKQILTEFPSIERAEISFRPPWITSFPKNSKRVKIQVTEMK